MNTCTIAILDTHALHDTSCAHAGNLKFLAGNFTFFQTLLGHSLVEGEVMGGGDSHIMLVYGYVPQFWGIISPF